jgi:hypothetical protein
VASVPVRAWPFTQVLSLEFTAPVFAAQSLHPAAPPCIIRAVPRGSTPRAFLPPLTERSPGRSQVPTTGDMASSSLQQMTPGLVSRCKTLINNDLKKICREEGLQSSGIKSVLQGRIIECTVTHTSPRTRPPAGLLAHLLD